MNLRPLLRRQAKAAVGWSLRTALRWSNRKVGVALLYHSVAVPPARRSDTLVPPTPPDLFVEQLAHLRRHYDVVTASELQAATADRRRGQRLPVAITFDDDDPDYGSFALPSLRAAGLTATFFLNGSSIDSPTPLWWRQLQRAWESSAIDDDFVARLPSPPPRRPPTLDDLGSAITALAPAQRATVVGLLTDRVGSDADLCGLSADGVREIVAGGFELGFHSLDHDYLPLLDAAELRDSLTVGRDRLAELAGTELTAFAYPSGAVSAPVRRAAQDAGYAYAFTTVPEPVRPSSDPLALGRITPPTGDVSELSLEIARTATGLVRRS